MNISPATLSLMVSLTSTAVVLPVGLVLAWWLSRSQNRPRIKIVVETLLLAPIVMPPTVLGYALLILLGNGSGFGRWVNSSLGIHLVFTWQAAAIAAFVMSFPLFIRPVSAAFEEVDQEMIESARTLGSTEFDIFIKLIIPISVRAILVGLTLAFARALGEFGATMMVAGNIDGKTQTLPLALFSAAESGNNQQARTFAFSLAIVAFVLTGVVSVLSRRSVGRTE